MILDRQVSRMSTTAWPFHFHYIPTVGFINQYCCKLYLCFIIKQFGDSQFGGNVCSPVEKHDLVSSLQNDPASQVHSRVAKCDGLLTVQVKADPVNRMVISSADVQTDLSEVVHPPPPHPPTPPPPCTM